MKQKSLHITIGSSPQPIKGTNALAHSVQNDLQLIKAALLYADKVKLCSLATSLVLITNSLEEFSTAKRIEFIEFVQACAPEAEGIDEITKFTQSYREARRKRYSKKGQATLHQLETFLDKFWPKAREVGDNLFREVGGNEVANAINSGLLEVHSFNGPLAQAFQDPKQGGWVVEFVNEVGSAVSDASTYPLFDQATGNLIRTGIRAKIIPVSHSALVRGKEIGLAADLIERLPLFEQASVDEILDIREELQRHLIRFRGAMINFSDSIMNAAWDEDFTFDAEQIFRRDVAPEILNIEDEVKANPYLAELTRKWITQPFAIPSGIAALGLSLSNQPLPALAALAVGTVINTALAVYDTHKEHRNKQLSIERNNLFFYYQAGKLIHK